MESAGIPDRLVRRLAILVAVVALGVLALGIFALTGPANPAPASSADRSNAVADTARHAVDTSAHQPTVGPVPKSAWRSDGNINVSQIPDFVPALGSNGGVVGYIPKSQLFPPSPSQPIEPTPLSEQGPYHAPTAADMAALNATLIYTVYGPDLTTVVGHEYPGIGFVPLGDTPPSSPTVTIVTGEGEPPKG